jgi:hypothetical protein
MFSSKGALLALLLAAGGPARAADVTDVASSFEEGNRFDFRFRVRYDHLQKNASVKREIAGVPGADSVQAFKDLAYSESRDSLALRAELGLYHDLMLVLELPVILSEQEVLDFDQSLGSGCAYPPQPNPTCVNQTNSTSVRDGIVPTGSGGYGYDATNRGNFFTSGSTVFKGPVRGAAGHGTAGDSFDTFNLGLTWAPMSQRRDDTKPTWIWTVQADISVGNVKRFDRTNPDGNHGVSEGVHRLWIRTVLSKRTRFFEPYWGLWYLLPIARSDSLFVDYGPAQKTKDPQMQAGTLLGLELHALEKPEKQYRLSFDVRARVEGHFAGRGYSEIWQLLAGASPLGCDPATNPSCDQTKTTNPYQNRPFTGITTIEGYATFGADIAIAAQIGPYVRLRTGFDYAHDTAHFITGDDIGTPLNGANRVTQPNEFNPAYREIVDLVGRRYRVDDVNVYNFYFWAQAMF